MRSRVLEVSIGHRRSETLSYAFTYRAFYLLIALDELAMLADRLRLYRHERRGFLSTWNSDMLDRRAGELRARLGQFLPAALEADRRVLALTSPRVCGVGFEPIRIYYVLDADDQLVGALAEVQNTYGDVHLYPLVCRPRGDGLYEAEHAKELFVSPFFGVDGAYTFRLNVPLREVVLDMELKRDSKSALRATVRGAAHELSDRNLARAFVRAPFAPALAFFRIAHQALMLRLVHGLRPRMRPIPRAEYTVRHAAAVHALPPNLMRPSADARRFE